MEHPDHQTPTSNPPVVPRASWIRPIAILVIGFAIIVLAYIGSTRGETVRGGLHVGGRTIGGRAEPAADESAEPAAGERGVLTGTLRATDSERFPYALETGARSIPLQLTAADAMVGKRFELTVIYTGEGRSFTIESMRVVE